MSTWLRRTLGPPAFDGDEDKTRAAGLLYVLLLAILVMGLAAVLVAPFVFANSEIALRISGLILVLSVVSFILMRRGHVRAGSILILAGLWLTFTFLMLLSGGVNSIFAMGYVTTTVVAGVLLGRRGATVVLEFSMVLGLVMYHAKTNDMLPEPILMTGPGAAWVNLTAHLVVTAVMLYLATRGIGEALRQTRRAAAALELQREFLEDVVNDRTQDLERRAVQLATAADVGRAAASILELESLTRQVVELVRGRFELHYVGLFLLDSAGEYAVLEAGTGEPGRIMKDQGHKLKVGGASMVGAACAQRRIRLAQDVGEERVRFENPLLPETRSEMALPLAVGDRVLGALDVQSTTPDAFSEGDVAVLQLVADQIAVAVDNARKFSEEAEVLEATSPIFRVSRRLVSAVTTDEIVEAIVDSVAETEADGCVLGRLEFSPTGEVENVIFLRDWNRHWASRFPNGATFSAHTSPLPIQVLKSYWTVRESAQDPQASEGLRAFLTGYGGRAFVNIPLRVGGQVVGFLALYRTGAGPFPPVSMRLFETMADQAAVALERARLLEVAQARATREHLVAGVASRIRETLDMDAVLKTGVEEIAKALDLAALDLRLGTDGELANEPIPGLLEE
jgi:GAF domain-containing protein